MNIDSIIEKIQRSPARSAWDKGVKEYAIEIIHKAAYSRCLPEDSAIQRKHLLAGAKNEYRYSWGGWSLLSNHDIAQRLCTPSELTKCNYGQNRPNANEDWLDIQSNAIRQAINLILKLSK